MTELYDVSIRLDERVRLLSALLAATDWPERAQARKPHGVHAHARATRRHVATHRDHPATRTLQSLLNDGATLDALFSLMGLLQWPDLSAPRLPSWTPPGWPSQLRDFYTDSGLDQWFAREDAVWRSATAESQTMLTTTGWRAFLQAFFGSFEEQLVFMPNIGYPADSELGVRAGLDLIAVVPPRLAWGDSPPWPFDEDAAYLHRAALTQYARLLLASYLRVHADRLALAEQTPLPVPESYARLHPTWRAQFTSLVVSGLVAIYLEDYVSAAEARGFVLLERRQSGAALLPGTVRVLRRYLDGLQAGRYTELADFLPLLPKQLRVASRIASL